MKKIFLVEPNEKYKISFKNYVLAYEPLGDFIYFSRYNEALVNFKEYLTYLNKVSKRENLFPGE
ncbi:MAG: hypothetical protein ACRC6E_04130, partial [Fusobacteriaceae bacterium]